MSAIQNLAVFILACQGVSSIFLMIGFMADKSTFERIDYKGHPAIPGMGKTVRLLRTTSNNLMMGLYFLALVFLVLSYVGFILILVQALRLLFS